MTLQRAQYLIQIRLGMSSSSSMSNFIQELVRNGMRFAEKIAITSGVNTITYASLLDEARRNNAGKTTCQVVISEKFGIASQLLAAWNTGSVAVPIDPSLPKREIDYRMLQLDGAESHLVPQDDALILFTSGTTGRAKGVIHTIGSVDAQIKALRVAWEWTEQDRLLLPLPLTHVHGLVTGLLSALSAGASVELTESRFDPDATWKKLTSGKFTVFTAVPTVYGKLVNHFEKEMSVHQRASARTGVRKLRLMISGSAPLPERLFNRWAEITGQALLERYGTTETGIVLSNPLRGPRVPNLVGSPLGNVDIKIEGGELLVRGATLFRGYLNSPDATLAALQDGWYHTGDQAMITPDGIKLLGRSHDILKVGGYKVSALEVENAVLSQFHYLIKECAVLGMPDVYYGELVTLAYVADDELFLSECHAKLQTVLGAYQLPRKLVRLKELPRNAMGKVDKKLIASQL